MDYYNNLKNINSIKFDYRIKKSENIETVVQNLEKNLLTNFSKEEVKVKEIHSDNSKNIQLLFDSEVKVKLINVFLGSGFSSNVLHFMQPNSNCLVIWHDGHGASAHLRENVIKKFIDTGCDVLAFAMPLSPGNNFPKNLGSCEISSHQSFSCLENNKDYYPLSLFFTPLKKAIDVALTNYSSAKDLKIFAVGLSGGGWTLAHYSAIDNRIDYTFLVSATIPYELRKFPHGLRDVLKKSQSNMGDWEQRNSRLISSFTLYDLALIHQIQQRNLTFLFIDNDLCCFRSSMAKVMENKLTEILKSDSNFIKFNYDKNSYAHDVTKAHMDFITSEISQY
ncbi:MAG: hypothetical protein V4629_01905 [Pseudomonadota bacterium]